MSGTVADSLVDQNSTAMKEFIGEYAIEHMVVSEPMFANAIIDSTGLEDVNNVMGRDYRIKSRYFGSLAGTIRGGNVKNFMSLYGDTTAAAGPNIFTNSPSGTYPDPFSGANPRTYGLTSKLYSVETNLAISQTMLDLEATQANIKEQVLPLLRGFGKLLNLWACNSIHVNPDNQYRLGSLGLSTGTGAYTVDTTNKAITFYPTEKCTHRFAVGQPVDLFKNTTTLANKSDTTTSRVRLFVGNVDDAEGSVTLQADPSGYAEDGSVATFGNGTTTGWAGTTNLSTGAFVVSANTYNNGFAGMYTIRDWFKWYNSSGTTAQRYLLGASAVTDSAEDYIDVSQHNEFKSQHFGSVGTLNNRKLCGQVAGVIRGFVRHGHTIDSLIASDGVWLNIFDQDLARTLIMGSQMPGSIQGRGFDGAFSFTYDGVTVTGKTSRFIESGVIYGAKTMNNWRFVAPPSGTGMSRGSMPDKKPIIPLEFVGKALGHASDRIPYQVVEGSVVKTTEWSQMPGRIRLQFMPRQGAQIPGVVWEGVSETRIYSAA